MSQGNVEIVRRNIDAFGRGDLEGVRETLAPEFEMHPSGRFMDIQRIYRGREGWTAFWGDFRAAWKNVAVSIERMEADQHEAIRSCHSPPRNLLLPAILAAALVLRPLRMERLEPPEPFDDLSGSALNHRT